MKIFSSLLFASLGLLWISCGKDSDPKPAETKTDLITASAWTYQDIGADITGDGNIDVPLSSSVPACVTDNALTFKSDGTATSDEGATKCNSSDPQTSTFNWSFASSETSLVVSNNSFSALNGTLKIKTLTATALTLAKDTAVGGLPATVIVNLKH